MGHDIQACHALELMKERTANAYRVQGEAQTDAKGNTQGNFQPPRQNPARRGFGSHGRGYDRGGGRGPMCYNCGDMGHIQRFCTNHAFYADTVEAQSMKQKSARSCCQSWKRETRKYTYGDSGTLRHRGSTKECLSHNPRRSAHRRRCDTNIDTTPARRNYN